MVKILAKSFNDYPVNLIMVVYPVNLIYGAAKIQYLIQTTKKSINFFCFSFHFLMFKNKNHPSNPIQP